MNLAVQALASWRGLVLAALALSLSGCVGLLYFDEPGAPQRRGVAPAGPAPATGATTIVQRGDTLYSIAFRNNLDYRQLAAWNGIGDNYTIYAGQRLRLSPPPQTATAMPAPTPIPVPAPASAADASAPGFVMVSPAPVPAQSVPPVVAHPAPAPAISPAPATAPVTVSKDGWQWPTAGTVSGRFNPPGEKGIEIGGHYGQAVLAATAGVVVYSGNALKGYGELVILKHSDDYLSAYGFNQRRLVQEGETVRAGQVIAQMGEGPGQVPELHFEIRYKGQPVDPLKYLPSR